MDRGVGEWRLRTTGKGGRGLGIGVGAKMVEQEGYYKFV
jgi:hypothetical protein